MPRGGLALPSAVEASATADHLDPVSSGDEDERDDDDWDPALDGEGDDDDADDRESGDDDDVRFAV